MKWQILQLLYRYLHTNINQHTCLKDVLWKGYMVYMYIHACENCTAATRKCTINNIALL